MVHQVAGKLFFSGYAFGGQNSRSWSIPGAWVNRSSRAAGTAARSAMVLSPRRDSLAPSEAVERIHRADKNAFLS